MKYCDAKKLHNEDEVIIKAGNWPAYVVSVEVKKKAVFVMCDDGNVYHHTEIR